MLYKKRKYMKKQGFCPDPVKRDNGPYLMITWLFMISAVFFSCVKNRQTTDFLIRIADGSPAQRTGYVNSRGDTIVAPGKYACCFSDTIRQMGFVLDSGQVCLAINKQGRELFRVYWFDNGPDYFSDGRIRMIRDGLIGYADKEGRIVIPPAYQCAGPFRDGKARVSYRCQRIKTGEHIRMESDEWFFIDKKGNRLP